MEPDRATAVLITSEGVRDIDVDASEKSPFTHDALGGTPTFLGTWNECIYMLGLAEPNENAAFIDSSLIPRTQRESGPIREPVLICKLNDEYKPINFTTDDLLELTTRESGATTQ